MIIGDMEIRLRADLARLQRDMTQARQVVGETASAINRAATAIRGALAGAFAVTAIIEASKALIETQRAFDKLNASLITATGSAANAKQAFGALQAFAATTPFGLQEVTEGFIKLRNLGMTPSERALTSYGNTASAMSKSLNQMIEAVADAASGEFERLKEFGIKASQNGDKVSLTFQGVTTTIGNNAAEIEQYLIKLGETKFGGGMALQAATLDGAIGNLGDTWEATKRKISAGGFGDAAQSGTLALTGALTDLGAILDVVAGKAKKEGEAVQEASLLHQALTTVFETVAVLGLNVAYVFTQVGREMGGLAAQAAAVATGDFALAKQIGVQMRADAAAARAEVDAKSEAILKASEKARKAAEAEAAAKKAKKRDDLAQFALEQSAAEQSAEALKKKEEAAKKARQEYEASAKAAAGFAAKLMEEREQVGLAEDQIKMLAAARAAAKAPTEELRQKIMAEALALDIARKAWEDKTEAEKAAAAATAAADEQLYAATTGVWDQVAAMQKQVDLFGLTEDQVLKLQQARLEADLAAAEGDEKKIAALTLQIEGTQKLIELAGQKQFLEESKKAADEAEKVQKSLWESIDKTAHDTFVSIMDGSKSAAQRLKDTFKNIFFDWLYQMTLKKWIVNLQGQFSAGGVGGVAGMANGGGLGGLLQSGQNIYNAISSGFSSLTGSVSSMLGSVGNFFGSSTLSGFASGMGSTVAGSGDAAMMAYANATGNFSGAASIGYGQTAGALTTAAAGIAAGVLGGRMISGQYGSNGTVNAGTAIGAVVGSIIPGLGTAIGAAIGGIIGGIGNRLFGMGAKEVTGTTLTGNLGGAGFDGKYLDAWTQKGGWFRSDKSGTTPRDIDATMATGLGDAYAKITAASRDYAKALGVDADFITGRSQSLSIALTKDQAANEKAITDFFTGVANTIAGELVPGLSTLSKEGEAASATLERLAVQYTAVDAVLKAIGASGESAFGAVGVASLAARERLLTLTGGLDAFASQTAFFAQNFLTEAERLAPVQDQVTAKMAELGMASVDTIEEFAAAVQSLTKNGGLATEAGAAVYAELMKIAPAFKQVADFAAAAAQKAIDDAAAAAQRLVDANAPYLERILKLEESLGAVVDWRARETAGMDASTIALYDREKALQADVDAMNAQKAAEAQARQERDAAYEAGKAAAQQFIAQQEALAQRRAAMEIQLYELTHTAAENMAAARARELAATPPVLQALQQQINANQDLASAATAAAKEIEDAAARARAVAQERAGIERSILQLQGNTGELRKLELAALDPANRARQEAYYALQDKMAADQAAAAQAQAMAEAQQRAMEAQARAAEEARRAEEALKQARQSATDAIFDEVARIRGLVNGGGAKTLAGAQSAFAIATARARAGDLEAMKALPGLSKSLLDLAEQNAASLFDLRLIQAQTAASLQMSGAGLAGQFGLTVPSYDVGTNNITRTGLALVHQGEEIVPAASNGPYRSSGTDMNAVLAELRALREEVASFHRDNSTENRGMACDGKRVADGLEQVTGGFDAMRTKEEA